MATQKHTQLDLLGAHVRGQYVIRDQSSAFEFSFDGIVESVVIDLHPEHAGAVMVAGEFHAINDCTRFQIVAPAALADRKTPSITAVRAI